MAQEPQHPCFHPAPLFEGCTGTICIPCENKDLLEILHPLQWVAKMEKDSNFPEDFLTKWKTKTQRVALLLHLLNWFFLFWTWIEGHEVQPYDSKPPKHLLPTSKNMIFTTHQGKNSLGAEVNISGSFLTSILSTFTRLLPHQLVNSVLCYLVVSTISTF